MQLTLLHGYPDLIGKRSCFVGNGKGPASYAQVTTAAGGDPVVAPAFQYYFDAIFPAVSVSGTYVVYPIPTVVGFRQAWRLKWVTISTGTEVTAATNLSAESVQLAGFGGTY